MMRIVMATALLGIGACGAETRHTNARAVSSATPATPCVGGPALVATDLYQRLERFSTSVHIRDFDRPLPRGRFGGCAISEAVIRDASGAKVAELNCGLTVYSPGIVDHTGLGIGATGSEVMARQAKADTKLVCVKGRGVGRCWFVPEDDAEEPLARYTVDGEPSADVLRGARAAVYFAPRRIIQFHQTIHCH